MGILREGILDIGQDVQQEVGSRLDQYRAEMKKKITTWILKNTYTCAKKDFRKTSLEDFEIDDDLLISLNKSLEGISLFGSEVPNYIKFKYVSKEFKIGYSTFDDGDASNLLKNLSRTGIKAVKTIYVSRNVNLKTLGDLSTLNCMIVTIEDNPLLNMNITQLPKISVGITYKNNKNKLSKNDIRQKLASNHALKDFISITV